MSLSILDSRISLENTEENPKDSVTQILWNPFKRDSFGVSSFDGTFRIFDLFWLSDSPSISMTCLFRYRIPLTCFAFIPESSLVLLGTANGKILLLNYSDQNSPFSEDLIQLNSPILKVYFTNNSGTIVIVDMDRTVLILNYKTQEVIKEVTLNYPIQACDFNFPLLVLALSDQKLFMLDLLHLNK